MGIVLTLINEHTRQALNPLKSFGIVSRVIIYKRN